MLERISPMSDLTYFRSSSVRSQSIDTGFLLYDLRARKGYMLHATAEILWRLLDEHPHLDDLVGAFCARFPEVKPDVMRVDLRRTLENLEGRGLVRAMLDS
jgi:hypothetical protein